MLRQVLGIGNCRQPDFTPLTSRPHTYYNLPSIIPNPTAFAAVVFMAIRERLETDIKAAMRSRNQQRLDALRYLKSAINRVEIDTRATLDDAGVVEVVTRQVKDRRDSIRMFEQGNRADLVAKEAADLAVLEEYLPPQLDEAEIVRLVEEVIGQVGAVTIRDKGKVMGRLMPQVRGKADGALVNALVTQRLEAGG